MDHLPACFMGADVIMKSWILTGGAGCGKSAVSEMLVRHLALKEKAVFSADAAVGVLLDDVSMADKLRQAFGPSAVSADQGRAAVNRAWLRSEIFSDDAKRARLEGLLHPGVLARLEAQRADCAGAGENLFLAEVPLHYEIGATVSADLIIVVAASPEVQKRRLMERRGLDESIIEQMLRAQWPIEAKVERANVVIWNDGDLNALEAQVLTLARQHWQA